MTPREAIKKVVHNGEMIPFADARVSVMAPGFTYAANVFEGVRAYWNADTERLNLFRLDEHLDRMMFSMRLMRLEGAPSKEELKRASVDVIRENGFREDSYLRIQAYVDDWGEMISTSPVGWGAIARPRPRTSAFEEGRHFCVSSWRRNRDNASPPRVKAVANYFNSRLAGLEAKEKGFDGPIILTDQGTVSEGPGGCIFIVRNGILCTPSITSGILESVTRATLLELAKEAGIPTAEREIDRTELYCCEEVFYCGTGQELTPVLSVDGMPAGEGKPGVISRQLQKIYDDTVRGRTNTHPDWLTPVI